MILFHIEDVNKPKLPYKEVKKWISFIIENHKKKTGDINYIFCSNEYILKVNNKYLSHNYFTDIITFNYNEGNNISGDIFISIETVLSNAQSYNVTFNNELFRVMIHGILHLIGFDDQTIDDKKLMTNKEDESLSLIHF